MELAYGLRFEINYPIPSDKSNYTLSLWPEKGSEIAEPEPKLLTSSFIPARPLAKGAF